MTCSVNFAHIVIAFRVLQKLLLQRLNAAVFYRNQNCVMRVNCLSIGANERALQHPPTTTYLTPHQTFYIFENV